MLGALVRNVAKKVGRSVEGSNPWWVYASSRAGSQEPESSVARVDQIRNFCITAHIDHGKTTLADAVLRLAAAQQAARQNGGHRQTGRQVAAGSLDSLQVERERGITVKSSAVTTYWTYTGSNPAFVSDIPYQLNLIDTPGHVDFAYEVSRSLFACSGAVILVDANKGVEAQTVNNFYAALEAELALLPALSKIDLPAVNLDQALAGVDSALGFDPDEISLTSAKDPASLEDLLNRIVEEVPHPTGSTDAPLKALLFDSYYDRYHGVVAMVKVVDGLLKTGARIEFVSAGVSLPVVGLGTRQPEMVPASALSTGQVGYVVTGMKDPAQALVGDTLIAAGSREAVEPLAGFQKPKPLVYAGVFPAEPAEFAHLGKSIDQLLLNDSSITLAKESSPALGMGFRLGFLGVLHLDVFKQRLEQEFDADIIVTNPTVPYLVRLPKAPEDIEIRSPAGLPDPSLKAEISEPTIVATLIGPARYLSKLLGLAHGARGIQQELTYLGPERVLLRYSLPLSEVITEFTDRLASATEGYASFDYEMGPWVKAPVVRLDILLNGEVVEPLSALVHADRAVERGRAQVERLTELLPRQNFAVAVQAAVGSKILARGTVKAFRKDVTAKLYGGDVTRKKKLLEKQKKGKKRMLNTGKLSVPSSLFIDLLKSK